MGKPIYLDPSYSPRERAEDLVGRMTAEEKASQLRFDAPAIERLGIPEYNYWNEALHGVARAGTATMFPQAIGMAAMFDAQMLYEIAQIIAEEGRAKYNEAVRKNDRDIYKGLTYWSPNINIFRDPRWGRGHETYGEDPYLTSRLGVSFIEGLQGNGKHMKLAACAKHFAVHSGPESLRHEFDAKATPKDMAETYLPAFEAAVKEAGVEAVMGAYNRTNGEPCCGSKTLLQDILREKWGFQGHVTSDCWAIRDFHTHHMVTKTAPESAALALKNGCDTNCGNTYLHLMEALQEGLITEEDLTRAAVRLFTTRMKLGMFDEDCEYDQIPYEANDSEAHHRVSREASRKSMVLLKNDGLLPLDRKKIKNIAVIGPNANSHLALMGNYYGTPSRYITFLEGVHQAVSEETRVWYAEGCHLYKDRVENLAKANDRMAEAVSVAERCDVALLFLGLDSLIEGEEGDEGNAHAGGDKPDLNLPGQQQKLLEAVCATGTPVVLVLSAGSAMAIGYAQEHCSAILDVWYPGNYGGAALCDLLFGDASPSGKLPVTFYHDTSDLPDFTDYSMKGRTYRYLERPPLYPFGYGLTYSKVEAASLSAPDSIRRGDAVTVELTLENKGTFDVEEVAQVYLKDLESPNAVKNWSLAAFQRVALKAGERRTVSLTVQPHEMEAVNEAGERSIESGRFTLFAGISQPDERSAELLGTRPLARELRVVE